MGKRRGSPVGPWKKGGNVGEKNFSTRQGGWQIQKGRKEGEVDGSLEGEGNNWCYYKKQSKNAEGERLAEFELKGCRLRGGERGCGVK